MRRKFKMRQLTQDAVPTTSLADMMFLLLIFFIMTTTLAKTTGFITDVPMGTKGAQQSSSEKSPSVVLHDGKITVNDDQNMTMQQLRNYITGLRLDRKQGDAKVVIISAEGVVPYQMYYETLAMVQNASGVVAIVSDEVEKK